MKIMITGANGHLGRKLMKALLATGEHEVVAVVRSDRAAATIRGDGIEVDIRTVDYTDATGLSAAAAGCDAVIHLVGIIKESRANTFAMAHEAPCQALVDAKLDVQKIICLGVLGTGPGSSNACFQSRQRAEEILLNGDVPAAIIRVPMVLGEGDYASMSLAAKSRTGMCFSFRAASLEQPIDSNDVVSALLAALALPTEDVVIDLAGPTSLSRKALISRAASLQGKSGPTVISLPIGLGKLMAGIFEAVSGNPPVTRAMLGVLDHDDDVDAGAAASKLGITLTPLDDTLNRVLS